MATTSGTNQQQIDTIISETDVKYISIVNTDLPVEGNSTPVVDPIILTPPKKHKRAAPTENDAGLGTGRETSEVWKYYVSMMSEGISGEEWQAQWEKYLVEEGNEETKSDLEKYLADGLEMAKDLNILAWWKDSSKRYPIVSRIARDILAIPISTVASKSAFSTGGRVLDSYRSSLSPKTVEALICTQQWLRSTPKECNLEDLLEEIQKLEIVENEYPDTILSID